METITLGTFNCENLFGRYQFRKGEIPTEDGGFTINELAFEIYIEEDKRLTAQAIRATRADILGLQEVENLPVLDTFTSTLLNGSAYRHRVLIHGNARGTSTSPRCRSCRSFTCAPGGTGGRLRAAPRCSAGICSRWT